MNNPTNNKSIIIIGSDLNAYKKYVVTIITNNIKAQGLVYVNGQNLYVLFAAHILSNNNIYLNVLFKNINNTGTDRILKLQCIGFERVSDVGVLQYFPETNGYMLDVNYYRGVQLVPSLLSYTNLYYNISIISDLSDVEIQSLILKNSNFFGDIIHLIPPSVLFQGQILNGSSGSPVFDVNGNLCGIVSSKIKDTELNQIVSTYIINLIVYTVLFNWREYGSKLQTVYELGNYLKRSVRYGFFGMNMRQYDIILANNNYYLTLENFRITLNNPDLKRVGGILINDFIHGYNNVEKNYVYNPFQPIYTGFKIENPFKNSNIYKNFYKFRTGPVVLASIYYYDSVAHLQDYEKSGVLKPATDFYVKNYLGKYSGQQSVYNFIYTVGAVDNVQWLYFKKDPFTLPPLPFKIEYYYNDGKNWIYDTESVIPFPVFYLDENNKEFKQYSIELPYPLYGADIINPFREKYLPLFGNEMEPISSFLTF